LWPSPPKFEVKPEPPIGATMQVFATLVCLGNVADVGAGCETCSSPVWDGWKKEFEYQKSADNRSPKPTRPPAMPLPSDAAQRQQLLDLMQVKDAPRYDSVTSTEGDLATHPASTNKTAAGQRMCDVMHPRLKDRAREWARQYVLFETQNSYPMFIMTLTKTRASPVGVPQLKAAGCDLPRIRALGFTASQFKDAGFGVQELKGGGFSVQELMSAGFDLSALIAGGFPPPSLKAAGFDLAAFRAAGCDWSIVRAAGFSAAEAKAAGCDPASAQAAGYDVPSLLATYGYDAVAAAGCDVIFFNAVEGREQDLSSYILVSPLLCSCTRTHMLNITLPSPPAARWPQLLHDASLSQS
jgi:hypothetical protein